VTTDTWQRRALFRNSVTASIVEEAIFRYRDQGMYFVHRHVVMPDHLHVTLTPGSTTTLEKAVQLIKGGSSREIGKRRGMRFPVWHAGFTEHQIRDQREFDSHVRYIDENPVKARLAEKPEEYLHGSVTGKFALDPWPLASGAKAPRNGKDLTAGLKPRPSEGVSEISRGQTSGAGVPEVGNDYAAGLKPRPSVAISESSGGGSTEDGPKPANIEGKDEGDRRR
jgi:putative transposase